MLVYQNVLGRDPNPLGHASWLRQLNTGAMMPGK
jgi:hypothetical protein